MRWSREADPADSKSRSHAALRGGVETAAGSGWQPGIGTGQVAVDLTRAGANYLPVPKKETATPPLVQPLQPSSISRTRDPRHRTYCGCALAVAAAQRRCRCYMLLPANVALARLASTPA